LKNVTENSLWHDNQIILDHVIAVFEGLEHLLLFEKLSNSRKLSLNNYLSEKIGRLTRKEILIVGTLLHDISKIDTLIKKTDGTSFCPGHELISAGRVKNYSARFNLDKNDEEHVERIVRYH